MPIPRIKPPSLVSNTRLLTIAGVLCLIPPLVFWALWIRVSSLPYLPTFSARAAAFLSYFPSGFSVGTLSYLALAAELLALILSGAGVLSAHRVQKSVNIAVLSVALILTILSAFQLF